MRTPRLLASGTGYYHVILKTSGARFLFESDADKRALLGILERVSRFSGVQPLSYALLDNHVHLLLKVPERRSVPRIGDAVAVPQCRAGLFTATRLSGCLYRVA